jgi:hypothetical protein
MALEASRTKGDTHHQMAMLIRSPILQSFSAAIINQAHTGETQSKGKHLAAHGMEACGQSWALALDKQFVIYMYCDLRKTQNTICWT